jgi:hypothetical protein
MPHIDHEERYESEIFPLIEELDYDPFTASDLTEMSSRSAQSISHTLSYVADSQEYEILKVGRFPYVYSLEGNRPEEKEAERPKDESNDEDKKDLEEVYNFLDNEGEASESRVREKINEQIELESISARMDKNGELFQNLKGYKDAKYLPEQKKFIIED